MVIYHDLVYCIIYWHLIINREQAWLLNILNLLEPWMSTDLFN